MGAAPHRLGLADTSVFLAQEAGRPLSGEPPTHVAVSIVTVAELRLGVLAAPDSESRAQRLETLSRVEALEPLVVDRDVAGAWARLRLALRDAGRRMPMNDSWIAATALAHQIPVVSQDSDYDGVPLIALVRV